MNNWVRVDILFFPPRRILNSKIFAAQGAISACAGYQRELKFDDQIVAEIGAESGGSYMDDFQKRGQALIDQLKEHVLTGFSRDPRGSINGPGLGTIEIERLCGLGVELDRVSERKQEHWIIWTILQRLIADGLVVRIDSDKTRYRRR